jgi:hypothetical protein
MWSGIYLQARDPFPWHYLVHRGKPRRPNDS